MSREPQSQTELTQLNLQDIPESDAPFHDIYDFAHTIHGYHVAGSFEKTAEIAHDKTKQDLLSLRIRLFFCARAHRHAGTEHDSPHMRSIVAQIRNLIIENKSV